MLTKLPSPVPSKVEKSISFCYSRLKMPNPIKQSVANLPKDISEAVIKPVVDEAARMAEMGAQPFFGSSSSQQLDPQAEVKRKEEEAKKRNNILRFFDALKSQTESYKQHEQFLKNQKKQEEVAEEQRVKQFEIQKKQKEQEGQKIDLFRAQRKRELQKLGG